MASAMSTSSIFERWSPMAIVCAWKRLWVSSSRFVFAAHDGIHGPEPWVSDGTAAGTRLLRDLCPGACAGWEAFGLAHRPSSTR